MSKNQRLAVSTLSIRAANHRGGALRNEANHDSELLSSESLNEHSDEGVSPPPRGPTVRQMLGGSATVGKGCEALRFRLDQ